MIDVNNEPAFPTSAVNHTMAEYGSGMTLRDYFAAKTLPLVLPLCSTYESAATEAYKMADAMLRARDAA